MAQIRVKRTSTGRTYGDNNKLLPGEFGVAGVTVWYGPKETDIDDNTTVAALSLVSHQKNNTFTGSNTFNNQIIAPSEPINDSHLTNKAYVDAQISTVTEQIKIKINSDTIASNKWELTSSNPHLTIGSATGSAGNASIAFYLSNVAFTDTANTFAKKQTISDGIEVSGGAVFNSDVNITGNLTVNGTTTTLNTETLTVEDNLIVTNSKGADISATATNSGLAIRTNSNASNNAYGFVYNDGELKIGVGTIDAENKNFTSSSLQSVMTRTGLSTTANQMVYWDYANKTLRALTVASPLSFSSSTLSLGKITVANLGSGLITGNAERGSIVNGGNGAAYNVSNSIATQTQLGVVKIGNNLNIGTDGQLNGIVQEASSNKIPITGWTATTGDETTYGEYKFEIPFGKNGINYTDINYVVEVVQTISETGNGTGQYIEAPATIVKDNAANKLIVYTNNNSWNGYVIATSGGKLDSTIAGHIIYNRIGTTNGTALPSRGNLAFGNGLIASDNSDTGSSVVELNITAGNGIVINDAKQKEIELNLDVGSGLSKNYTGGTNITIGLNNASADSIGGVQLYTNDVQDVAVDSIGSKMGRTYAIQKNSEGKLVVNVPWEGSTYTNRTLQFKNNEIVVGTFNSLDASDLSSISFNNAIQASRDRTNSNQIIITDVLATMNRQGTVVAGYNSGTTSSYSNGVIDIDIDCGEWA